MEKGIYVRIADELRCGCAHEKNLKWALLRRQLSAGAEATESEFVTLDAESLLAAAKKRKKPKLPDSIL
ncbi:MAG: hypothetical protein K9N47_09000 [Prosthecobacter sp.]|uniref:hypothetical protein n=1 Tax=Prosthecobacter sp. TaxID=1965333 RepID=UPI0025D7D631|nr:hypothetical protein [Prosthecobacter sp.]MCF7786248.1 hypothetical protein [Prosthecobacter sp.]